MSTFAQRKKKNSEINPAVSLGDMTYLLFFQKKKTTDISKVRSSNYPQFQFYKNELHDLQLPLFVIKLVLENHMEHVDSKAISSRYFPPVTTTTGLINLRGIKTLPYNTKLYITITSCTQTIPFQNWPLFQ